MGSSDTSAKNPFTDANIRALKYATVRFNENIHSPARPATFTTITSLIAPYIQLDLDNKFERTG
jgi:hypothetical protein